MIFYIYTLSDSANSDDIRYVGVTKDTERRLKDHMKEAKKKGSHKNHWINSVIKSGRKLILTVVDTASELDWSKKEKQWIRYYRNLGYALVNGNDGGKAGYYLTEASRIKLSNSIKKSWKNRGPHILSKEAKENISRKSRSRLLNMSERQRKELSQKANEIKMLITTPLQRSETVRKGWITRAKNGNLPKSKQGQCKYENCEREAKVKGYCFKHYQRVRANEFGWPPKRKEFMTK